MSKTQQHICCKGWIPIVTFKSTLFAQIMRGLFPEKDESKGYYITEKDIDLILDTCLELLKLEVGEKWIPPKHIPKEQIELIKRADTDIEVFRIFRDVKDVRHFSPNPKTYYYQNI